MTVSNGYLPFGDNGQCVWGVIDYEYDHGLDTMKAVVIPKHPIKYCAFDEEHSHKCCEELCPIKVREDKGLGMSENETYERILEIYEDVDHNGRAWVCDQVLRLVLGGDYEGWVEGYETPDANGYVRRWEKGGMRGTSNKEVREKYTRRGSFKLSAGGKSSVYYDFRNMEQRDFEYVLSVMVNCFENMFGTVNWPDDLSIIGLKTMGWVLVEALFDEDADIGWYDPHSDTGVAVLERYVLVDDVITTGSTIEKAITYYGRPPELIVCLVNRGGLGPIRGARVVETLCVEDQQEGALNV